MARRRRSIVPESGAAAPVVVIAHGFAGFRAAHAVLSPLLWRATAISPTTFDFPGHGRNVRPLTGDLANVEGATRVLVNSLAAVVAAVRGLGDGRIAVLGHSMASDIVVRFAEEHPEVAATIAVSMFSPAVTRTAPRNLLVIDGEWEGFLKAEGLRAVGLATAPGAAAPGVTYGDPAAGPAGASRSAVTSNMRACCSVRTASARRSNGWTPFSASSDPRRIQLDARGPWILLLLAGAVALARPLAQALPAVARRAARRGAFVGGGFGRPLLIPMIATPALVLRFVPTHFLPVLVGDYLSVHFAVYGLDHRGDAMARDERQNAFAAG